MKFCPMCRQTYPTAMRYCLEDGALLSLQDPYHLVGRTLAEKYRIDALVGIGGMGAVYSALHLDLDYRVAFKILQPNLALGNQKVLKLFVNEARMVIRIAHDNVIRVMDAGRTTEGIAYITMEWLDGRMLEDELRDYGMLGFARTAELLRQIAAGLAAAHSSRIVHRDLKPSNVMMAKRPDGRDQVKVLDFGIGKALSENTGPGGVVGGTPHYGSPEQFRRDATVDERSDLYSLGVMLFQMLTGQLPFQADSAADLIKLHRHTPPPSLCELRLDAPLAVEEFVNQLLAKDPDKRPRAAAELAAAFDRAVGTSTLAAPPPQTQPQPRAPRTVLLSRAAVTTITDADFESGLPEHWRKRIEAARKRGRTGDILLLAEEATTWELQVAAHRAAGNALLRLRRFAFALQQYEKALLLNPADLESRQQKGILLNRLKRHDEAKSWMLDLIKDYPTDARAWGRLGRVEKEEWIAGWRKEGFTVAEMRAAADDDLGELREAIETYLKGSYHDPGYQYPAINALTLIRLLEHLTGQAEYTTERELLAGGICWTVHCTLRKNEQDYWAQATLGELELLSGAAPERVAEIYRQATSCAEENWFALDSTRQQLEILRDLDFQPAGVTAALQVMDEALSQMPAPNEQAGAKQSFLFIGHTLDRSAREQMRRTAQAIATKLDALGARAGDWALCGSGCGDLLFAEAVLARGLELQVHLPVDDVIPDGCDDEVWRRRFEQTRNHPRARRLIMADELGPPPEGIDVRVRNRRWRLYTALAAGPEKLRLICLRPGSDETPDGTEELLETARRFAGQIHIIDTGK